jgi:predicted sulfurtransferase
VVTFCTGGIRCEKAAIHMQNIGYDNVYQLEGGILKYFEDVGGAHYTGDCFVFDYRTALNPKLRADRHHPVLRLPRRGHAARAAVAAVRVREILPALRRRAEPVAAAAPAA